MVLCVGFIALAAARIEYQGQDLTNFYEGWHHVVGLQSTFTDKMFDVVSHAKEDLEKLGLQKPVMSLIETGEGKTEGTESMSEATTKRALEFLTPVMDKIESIEFEAMAARQQFGLSVTGLGFPRPDNPAAVSVWNAFIKSQTAEKDMKELELPSPSGIGSSMLETGSGVQKEAQLESSATYQQRMAAGAKRMRSSQGKQMLQFAEQYAMNIEKEAQDAQEEVNAMMDKLMGMTMEERKDHLEEYERLKKHAEIAKQAHESFDAETDQIYSLMAKFPDERTEDPETVAFDNKVEKEFEELLHDPKMQSMMQMTDEKTSFSMSPGSLLESSASTSMESQHMMSLQITAEGRVGRTGVDEEGTEEQGAAQAAELLKMFDTHVGHTGSSPKSLSSFIQTHDALSEQQREAAQAKALLQRRVSKAMSRSAEIDKLLDDAVMDYLQDPADIEEKPSVLEEIAGAFRGNNDPLFLFSEHPFIVRYRQEQKQNAVLPPRAVQRQIIDSLLKDAPQNMKMAVIHANLDIPGTRELKIQQDLICMKKVLQMMKDSDKNANGKEGQLRIFVDVQGGIQRNNDRVLKEIQRGLEPIHKVHALKSLGDRASQDYATGLADFVYRIGEGEIADSHEINMAAFKTEALKRGGIVKADVKQPPSDMCTLDNQNLNTATSTAFKKFTRINKIVHKVEQEKKEKKMLSETEQWAQQQRRVEHNHKSHRRAEVDVDFKPVEFVRGFGKAMVNFLAKGTRSQKQAAKAALYETSSHTSPRSRRGPNYGLYMPGKSRLA